MIRKYVFGKPFETDAVVKKIVPESGNMPYLQMYEQSMQKGAAVSVEQSVLNIFRIHYIAKCDFSLSGMIRRQFFLI